MKKTTFLKLLSAVLCLVTLISMLPACNNGGNGNVTTDDVTTESPETQPPEPDPIDIIKNGIVNYEIVYPEDTSKASQALSFV